MKENLKQVNLPFPTYGVKTTETPLAKEKEIAYKNYEKEQHEKIKRIINSKRGAPSQVCSARRYPGMNQPEMYKFLGHYGKNHTKNPNVVSNRKRQKSPKYFTSKNSSHAYLDVERKPKDDILGS